MKTTILLIPALALGLAACSTASTSQIGATVDDEHVANPAGQNSFAVRFDPQNPGIPLWVRAVSGKNEEKVLLRIAYPDGTTWEYSADSSTGDKQTAAIVATQQAVAQLQAQTGQAVSKAAFDAILAGVKAALGVPG